MRFEVTAQFTIEAETAGEADNEAYDVLVMTGQLADVEITDVISTA